MKVNRSPLPAKNLATLGVALLLGAAPGAQAGQPQTAPPPPPKSLTVGETAQFAERGGMIRFRREGERIGFDINLASSERAGLRISSQLLKFARIVGPGAGADR